MKAVLIALAASAALVSASPGGEIPNGVPINCLKANASYCMAGDILLRCDGKAIGTRSRCSDNVDGYPPRGGLATCYQSSEDAGDAACEKNCVVYAAQPFTLPADKCTPSSTTPQTGHHTTPAGTPAGTPATTKAKPVATTDTGIMSIPEGTRLGTAPHSAPTPVSTFPFRNSTTAPSGTAPAHRSMPTLSKSLVNSLTDSLTPTSTNPGQPDTTPAATTTTTSARPTNAANAKQAAGVMVAAGFFAALFL
ncbi:hypothetical protein E4U53_005436 [Claviceps sorghi]|nr:hypothetical protein E4U53_005436 [Claviceps sorghi]